MIKIMKFAVGALAVVVLLLTVQVIRLSVRINSMQHLAEFDVVQVRYLKVIDPEGKNTASLTAKELKMGVSSNPSDHLRMGISIYGPYLRMIAQNEIGKDPEAVVELGTLKNDIFGLNIQGRDTWQGLGIRWAGDRCTRPNQYKVVLEDTSVKEAK